MSYANNAQSSGTLNHTHRRISWAAIFGGVILAVTVQILLTLLGAGIGLGTINVQSGTSPDASTLGIGAALWWMVTSLVALAVGGYVSAWLAGTETRWDGMLHGLVTWGIAAMLSLYLLTSAVGGVVGGGFSALGSMVSAAGSGISSAAKPLAQAAGITPDTLQQQAEAYLKPVAPDLANMSPQDAAKSIATDLVTFAKGGPDSAAVKERIIDIMAAQQKIGRDQAAQQFDATQAKLQAEQQRAIAAAKTAADASAAAASKAAFGSFVALLIGAVAAALGGAFAVGKRVAGYRVAR
ncbi:MAG: hypothetical protein ACRYF2_18905 [Janthinobacterium lividum]